MEKYIYKIVDKQGVVNEFIGQTLDEVCNKHNLEVIKEFRFVAVVRNKTNHFEFGVFWYPPIQD